MFKQGYESSPGGFKHLYFNVTWQTGVLWVLTVAYSLALYESVKLLVSLALGGRLRTRPAVMFLGSVYPHVYGWWMFFNYVNDGFYSQLWHQVTTLKMIIPSP